ncbi:SagB family peptide dehydrogenase [Kitasatospora sp. NPDC098652]|uniref:SagB family peptide dehydrogenase n=1 Tax=Kitasatospora sp. NPDC098652 TaxID=3364095 RepID=UPI0038284280
MRKLSTISETHGTWRAVGSTVARGPERLRAAVGLLSAAAAGPREPYFADGPAAPDRRYHEESNFVEARMTDQRPGSSRDAPGARAEFGPVLATVPLPDPGLAGPAGTAASFTEVLLARRTGYGRYRGPFGLAELSALLHHAAGITAVRRPGPDTVQQVRAYPSGGARYPLQLLLYCHGIEGLERGLYRYEPQAHTLEQLDTADLSGRLRRCAPATDPDEPGGGAIDAEHCPLWVFTVGDLSYQRSQYGLRSYRLVLQESGHLAQNLALVATWLGKTSIGLAGYFDEAVNHLIGVDGVNSAVLYLHLFGAAGD